MWRRRAGGICIGCSAREIMAALRVKSVVLVANIGR
jgi:hypothetical protein